MKSNSIVKIEYNCSDRLGYSCFTMPTWCLEGSLGTPGKINVLELQDMQNQKSHYVSALSSGVLNDFNNQMGNDDGRLRINGNFAKCLDFQDGDDVIVAKEILEAPITVARAWVSCASADDWEILEPNAEILTNSLLNQLRIVYVGLKFPFWITKSMAINLTIDKLEPDCKYGILDNSSEVIVPSITAPSRSHLHLNEDDLRLRLHPVFLKENYQSTLLLLPSVKLLLTNIRHAFIHEQSLKDNCDFSKNNQPLTNNCFYAKIKNDSSDQYIWESLSQNFKILKVFILEFLDANIQQLIEENFPKTNPPCLFIHPELLLSNESNRSELKIQEDCVLKCSVLIEQVTEKEYESTAQKIQFTPVQSISQNQVEHDAHFGGYESLIKQGVDFLSASLSLGDTRHCFIGPEHGSLLITGREGSGKSSLAMELAQELLGFPYYVHMEVTSCAKLRGKKAEHLEKELLSTFEKAAKLQPAIVILDDFDVLIPSTSSEQQNYAEDFQHFRTSETVFTCISKYDGQQISFIMTSTSPGAINSYWKTRPGFHFFQLELPIPPPNSKDRLDIFQKCLHRYQMLPEEQTNATTCSQIEEQGKNCSLLSTETPSICLNLTKSTTQLNRSKIKSKSSQRENTTAECHCCLLSEAMKRLIESLHDEYTTAQFLSNLAQKWVAYLRGMQGDIDDRDDEAEFASITQDEISKIGNLGDMHKAMPKISWNQIGGLASVKAELTKILQWPIKYAKLFENSPVKLPTGILFYGYPGTGKTLLGLSLPSFLLNTKFIHIKGPELLSKYIGASEQAVKDVFRRAKESKPCILFFDEFDSLVPRRGHDSTGVTDRVVNQFLAEMDGVDGGLGPGVYLVASTSRPDLIDPAVLRPGRLDKLMFFPLPTQDERIEILKIQSEQMNSSELDLNDWNEIGHETEGFTGADLRSLLFSAQLIAIHEYLGSLNMNQFTDVSTTTSAGETEGNHQQTLQKVPTICKSQISITTKHLKQSLESFQPSLHGTEFKKFQNIFASFSSSRSRQRPLKSKVQQRATLA